MDNKALYDYLVSLEEDMGEEIELDWVDFCEAVKDQTT